MSEIRRMLMGLAITAEATIAFMTQWFLWRRRHQASAALAHYRSRHQKQLHYSTTRRVGGAVQDFANIKGLRFAR
jgi:hypothetical protein